MTEPRVLLTCIAIAFLMFALGLIVGIVFDKRRAGEGDSSSFSDTLTLWRSVISRIDEMTRRNVVSLGSIRERLVEIGPSMIDPRVVNTIDTLVKENHSLEREVQELRSHLETRRSEDHQDKKIGSLHLNTIEVPDDSVMSTPDKKVDVFRDLLSEVTNNVQQDAPLFDILDIVYEGLGKFIPYQRIGYAEIDYEADRVTAVWSRSERPGRLNPGYSATLSKSSLQFVATQGRTRVLHNLPEYLLRHPNSHSTRLIVEEGLRSSMTCPITVDTTVVGFLFLTSIDTDNFNAEHIALTQKISTQIGRAVHSSRLHPVA